MCRSAARGRERSERASGQPKAARPAGMGPEAEPRSRRKTAVKKRVQLAVVALR